MDLPNSVACLSLAQNLRCAPLNDTQYNILIIPPAIELVFCMALIILKWRSDRCVYIICYHCCIELNDYTSQGASIAGSRLHLLFHSGAGRPVLAHHTHCAEFNYHFQSHGYIHWYVTDHVLDNLNAKTFDATGSMSFVPMLSYTSYLFWMSYREFIISLPPRYQSTLKCLLIIFIPMVITTNEVASFVGVFICK